MSFQKSDILFLGHHHHSNEGKLFVSFDSRHGSADILILREVLALFGSQVVKSCEFGLNDQGTQTSSRIGFVTDLPFGELAKLNGCDSFPEMEARRIAEQEKAAEKKRAIKIRQQAEQALRDEERREIWESQEPQRQAEIARQKAEREREEEYRQKIAEGKRLAEKIAQDKLNKKIAELSSSPKG